MTENFSISGLQPSITRKSAVIAMSGGVDSSVAAMLAIQNGECCTGAFMKLCGGSESSELNARSVAAHLGIPFETCDFTEPFTKRVITRFVDEYRRGCTPNPCVDCNRHIKFGLLLDRARLLGAGYLMTGHYARAGCDGKGRYTLKKGADASKDQSYFLYTLRQEQLAMVRFPLGGLTKKQVRELASGSGLEISGARESQDICFIPDGGHSGFITAYTGEPPRKGRFTDIGGNDLGETNGFAYYTIGQRRGLGLSMPYPPYVLDIRDGGGTVVIGEDKSLYSKKFTVQDINLIPFDMLASPVRATVKIRYKHAGQPATVWQIGKDELRIEFDEPQRAITKGQAAVIYDGDLVIGGGTIS